MLALRIGFVCFVVVLMAGAAKVKKSAEEDTVSLPTLVVHGTHLPSSWLEIAWECRGPMPVDRIKRAWISKVASGSPAELAGFKTGDTLLAIGSSEVAAMTGLGLEANLKRERGPGTREEFSLQTRDEPKRIVVLVFLEK